jgi:hypothetical protein
MQIYSGLRAVSLIDVDPCHLGGHMAEFVEGEKGLEEEWCNT